MHELLTGSAGAPIRLPGFQYGALPLALHRLADHSLYALPIPQRKLEALLEGEVTKAGVTIHRGHEVGDLHQDDDQTPVAVVAPDGPYSLSARYLVAADGAHSVVRKRSGIGFPGFTDTGFVSRTGQVGIDPSIAGADGVLTVPGVGALTPATFARTDHGMFVFGMFQPGVFRVTAVEWDPEVDDSMPLTLAELEDSVSRGLGARLPLIAPPGELPQGLRRSTYTNSRQAARYRAGRAFLVGDAAHVQTGFGGPGLNLGMQDVLNLGWKLAGALNGWGPGCLLGT